MSEEQNGEEAFSPIDEFTFLANKVSLNPPIDCVECTSWKPLRSEPMLKKWFDELAYLVLLGSTKHISPLEAVFADHEKQLEHHYWYTKRQAIIRYSFKSLNPETVPDLNEASLIEAFDQKSLKGAGDDILTYVRAKQLIEQFSELCADVWKARGGCYVPLNLDTTISVFALYLAERVDEASTYGYDKKHGFPTRKTREEILRGLLKRQHKALMFAVRDKLPFSFDENIEFDPLVMAISFKPSHEISLFSRFH